jgi:hypothetical protein
MWVVFSSSALRTPPKVWVRRTLSWRAASAQLWGGSSSVLAAAPRRPRPVVGVATMLKPPARPRLPSFLASMDFCREVPQARPLFLSYASAVSMGTSTSYMPVLGLTRSSVMRGTRIWAGS